MKQMVCFGDSNTYGLIPGGLGRFDWRERWCGIVGDYVEKRGYRLAEEGLCGRTTTLQDPFWEGRSGENMFSYVLETHSPVDMLILMLGTNDLKSFFNPTAKSIGKGIEKLLDQADEICPEAQILLVSPIHLGEKIWWDNYLPDFSPQSLEVSKQLAKEYERIAKERNLYFLDAACFAKPSETDQIHMDAESHRSLAVGLIGILSEIL